MYYIWVPTRVPSRHLQVIRVFAGMTILKLFSPITTQFRKPVSRKRRKVESKQPAVYILASKRNGTLYIDVTSNLVKRIWEHKNNLVEGFTKRYGVHNLVWYELHENMESAILREKMLKEWKRTWKLELIENSNPNWHDLYDTIG